MAPSDASDLRFLAGGGEMGELIRTHGWDSTALGAPDDWPQALKTSVRMLLSTGHPMFIWWGTDLVQFYNDAYRRSIGPERHPSALGQRGRECWAEIWDIIGPQIEQVMTGTGYTWHENQLVPITRNGRREDVYWTYSYGPIDEPNASHGVGGVLVVCTETTEQVHSEQRMAAAEARWRALFEQAPGFMCVLQGPEHIFEFANPRYFELVGGRDVIGKPMREAVPEVEAQGFIALLDQVFESGDAHTGVATPLVVAPGSGSGEQQRYIDFVYQPIRDIVGNVTGIFMQGSDVTDLVTAGDKLRAQDERKDEFLAILAHELRNPLAAIHNASELLVRSRSLDARTHDIGSLLNRQVGQLTRLLDDLLDVSRITKGQVVLRHETVELDAAIDLAIEAIQPMLQDQNHEFIRNSQDGPLYVDGDSARIVQCITNVLGNAAKYTDGGGRIELVLRKEDGMGLIEIGDNGTGITAEMLPGIFEPFFQVDRTLDRAKGGLGLGLSVCQRLVLMHGGRVNAASDGPGHGSVFTIRLPLTDAPLPERGVNHATPGGSHRVLIVDDNVDAADLLARVLRLQGHEVEMSHGARDALTRIRQHPVDVVVLDIGLPEMDGYDLARQLRAEQGTRTLIALTGYGNADDVLRAEAAGFDAHFTKPVDFERLARLLGARELDPATLQGPGIASEPQ